MADEVPRDSVRSEAEKDPRVTTDFRSTQYTSKVEKLEGQPSQFNPNDVEDERLSKLRFDKEEERRTRFTTRTYNSKATSRNSKATTRNSKGTSKFSRYTDYEQESDEKSTQLQLWLDWVKKNKYWVMSLSFVGVLFFVNLVLMAGWYARDNGGFPRNFDFNAVCPLSSYNSELKGCCNILTKTETLDAAEKNYIQPCLSISMDNLIEEANLEDFGLLPNDQSFDPTRVENKNGADAFLSRNQCPPRFRQATLTRYLSYYRTLRHVCCDRTCDKWTYTRVKQLCSSCQSFCPPCDQGDKST